MRIYKRGKSWYLDINFEGRRIRRKIKGARTKTEAESALTAVNADILRGEFKFKQEKRILFEDFSKEYLEYVKVNKKSWKRDLTSLKKLIPFFRGMLLSNLDTRKIEEYKRERVAKVTPASVNRELACLKFMYSLAKKWKLVDENPVKEVKFFQERKLEMRILDKGEINRLIEITSDHLKPIIIIALNTGMRRSEIFNLRWNDIDFDKHFIFIKETKSGIARRVPMNSLVVNALKRIKRESEFLFYNPKTKNSIKDVKRSFKTACRKVGITDLRFHDLRHTAATYMVTGGIDLVTVSEILGHSDIKMTMRYAHPTPENRRRAVNVLADVFSQKDENQKISGTDMAQATGQSNLIH